MINAMINAMIKGSHRVNSSKGASTRSSIGKGKKERGKGGKEEKHHGCQDLKTNLKSIFCIHLVCTLFNLWYYVVLFRASLSASENQPLFPCKVGLVQ